MNSDIEIFHQILDKYKLVQPVPYKMQDYIVENRELSLKEVLKRAGQYTLMYWFVILIHAGFKKIGIKLTILQSKIIFGTTVCVISVTAAGGTYAGGNYIYKNYFKAEKGKVEIIDTTKEKDSVQEVPKIEKALINKGLPDAAYHFGIQPFKGENKEFTTKITDSIVSRISSIKGVNNTTDLRRGREKNINVMVFGSVRNFGSNYIITAKVIQVENSKVLCIVSENIKSEDEIDKVCSNIAKKITDAVK